METVLVIDDESSMRQPLCIALRSKGFHVLEATCCQDGICLAKTKQPNLIVCDVNMQDGTGHDVLDALKGNPATSSIPFIFMTGNNDPDELRRSMEQGADDFLSKPFPLLTFLAAVEARLRRGAMLRAQAEQIEKRLQAIVEANPDMVAMADFATQQILYLNRAGRDMLELDPKATLWGLRLGDIHSPSELARLSNESVPTAVAQGA